MQPPPAEASAPNWAQITTEPQCPLCEYVLRGLSNPRCPECGYTFDWAEVLEASRRDHPYLYEHHPERNIWSLFRTMWGAMWPQKFWTRLHPGQYGSIERLLGYSVVQLAIFTAVLLVQPLIHICFDYSYGLLTIGQSHVVRYSNQYWIHGGGQSQPSLLTLLSQACSTTDTWHRYLLPWFLVLAWPLMTHLSLQLYDISMRRAKIKPVHVLRCVLYSFDAIPAGMMVIGCTLGAFIEIMTSYANGYAGSWRYNFPYETIPWMVVIPLIGGYRLAVAYWRYLRFQHVVVVVASSQIITGLVLAIITVFVVYP